MDDNYLTGRPPLGAPTQADRYRTLRHNEASVIVDNRLVQISTVMKASLGDYTIHKNKLKNKLWRITGRTRKGVETIYTLERKDELCTHVISPTTTRDKMLFKVYNPSGHIDI